MQSVHSIVIQPGIEVYTMAAECKMLILWVKLDIHVAYTNFLFCWEGIYCTSINMLCPVYAHTWCRLVFRYLKLDVYHRSYTVHEREKKHSYTRTGGLSLWLATPIIMVHTHTYVHTHIQVFTYMYIHGRPHKGTKVETYRKWGSLSRNPWYCYL